MLKSGVARVWIMDKEIANHRNKISVGTHGYFMKDSKKVVECVVTELIHLKHLSPD